MADTKELIIFIPGMGVNEPEEYLEKLMKGIRSFCQTRGLPLRSLEDSGEPGTGRRQIEVKLEDSSVKTIDIQETYWADLRPLLSSESIMRKFLRGFNLLIFWVSSLKTWSQVRYSKFMMFNMIFTLMLMLTWYYGALAAGVTAIVSNPDFFGYSLPDGLPEWFKNLGKDMGGWSVWAIAAIFMGLLPVNEMIDISYSTKGYLQNRHGMRHKVCGRIAKALADAGRSAGKGYDRITVLAHSFGVVVETEVLADYTGENAPKARAMTLGGPLLLIAARSDRVQKALDRFIANDKVETWVDFFSDQDWLCTKSPVDENVIKKFQSRRITATVPFDEMARGESHNLYFDDPDVISTLLH